MKLFAGSLPYTLTEAERVSKSSKDYWKQPRRTAQLNNFGLPIAARSKKKWHRLNDRLTRSVQFTALFRGHQITAR